MNAHLPDDVITALKCWAAAKPEIARLHVFGSRVRGINKDGGPVRPDSDLDIGIELAPTIENKTDFWMHDTVAWRRDLAALIPYPVHLELLDEHSDNNRRYLDQGGVLVFERDDADAVEDARCGSKTYWLE